MYKKLKPIPRFIATLWTCLLIFVVLSILFFWGVSGGMLGRLPSIEELENPKTNQSSEIISEDGIILGKFYIENRSNVSFKELSPNVVNALIATEDSRYFRHAGIDMKGLARVVFKTVLFQSSSSGGGSTISQQLAKNLFTENVSKNIFQRGVQKLKEWVIAVQLERRFTKEEIIALYLNTVQFDGRAYGIKSASKSLFNTTPDKLTVDQAAVMVGMLKAISKYSPVKNYENSLGRRNVVMKQMKKHDYISEQSYDSLIKLPITLDYSADDHNEGLATHFREYLRLFLTASRPEEEDYREKRTYEIDKYFWDNNPFYGWTNKNLKPDGNKYDLYKDGLRIYVTLNSVLQKYAEEATVRQMGELQKTFFSHWKNSEPWGKDTSFMMKAMRNTDRWRMLKKAGVTEKEIKKSFKEKRKMRIFTYAGERDTIMTPYDSVRYYKLMAHAGFMAMDPKTGAIKAWVGGTNHKYFKLDHVNMHATRQVGSTFKPFVYTRFVDEKKDICMKVPDQPVTFLLEDGTSWTPKNADGKSGDDLPLWKALALSKNNSTAYLMKSFGDNPWETVMQQAKRMGVRNFVKSDEVYSLCLGIATLSLYEMTGAYATFANKGVYTEPFFVARIEDKNGVRLSPDFLPPSQDAMSEKTAFLMFKIMERVTAGGTASNLRSRFKIDWSIPIAGKTGTTQNQSDGWFIGITPDLACGAWVGWEDMQVHFRSLSLGSGGTMAMPIFGYFMQKAYEDKKINLSKKGIDVPKNTDDLIFNCSQETYQEDQDGSVDWRNQ